MSQIWAVLAWLPLDRLLQLYSALPENLVRARLLLVNKISGPELVRVSQALTFPGSSQTELYIRVCGYQGELCRWSSLYLRPEIVAARAEVLGDVPRYMEGILRCRYYADIPMANKQIKAHFLALKGTFLNPWYFSEDLFDRSFLEYAAWFSQSDLSIDDQQRCCYRILGGLPTDLDYLSDELLFFVFVRQRLLHPELIELDACLFRKEIALALRGDLTPEEIADEAAELGFVLKINWAEFAVQPPARPYSNVHFRNVWPEALRLIPGAINFDSEQVPQIKGPKMIERCRRMLTFLAENPRVTISEDCQMALRVACGMRIEKLELCRAPLSVRKIMFQVGHPQLRREFLMGLEEFGCEIPRFCYDRQKLVAAVCIRQEFQVESLLWLLGREGQLFQLLDREDIVELLRDPLKIDRMCSPIIMVRYWQRMHFNMAGLSLAERLRILKRTTVFVCEEDATLFQSLFPGTFLECMTEALSEFSTHQERAQAFYQHL